MFVNLFSTRFSFICFLSHELFLCIVGRSGGFKGFLEMLELPRPRAQVSAAL